MERLLEVLEKSLNFTHTYMNPAFHFSCSSQDHISVVVYIDGKEEVLDTYCGQKTPPQLMSNGVRMKVIFRSESSQKINVSGFKLEYSFRTGQWQFLEGLGDILCFPLHLSVRLSVTKLCPLYNLITVRDISTKLHTFMKHIQKTYHAQES